MIIHVKFHQVDTRWTQVRPFLQTPEALWAWCMDTNNWLNTQPLGPRATRLNVWKLIQEEPEASGHVRDPHLITQDIAVHAIMFPNGRVYDSHFRYWTPSPEEARHLLISEVSPYGVVSHGSMLYYRFNASMIFFGGEALHPFEWAVDYAQRVRRKPPLDDDTGSLLG